jgi:large subunit ribosomal protein L6
LNKPDLFVAMSRIGKKPVPIPAGVTAKLEGQSIAVKGAKGELNFTAPDEVAIDRSRAMAVHVAPRARTRCSARASTSTRR